MSRVILNVVKNLAECSGSVRMTLSLEFCIVGQLLYLLPRTKDNNNETNHTYIDPSLCRLHYGLFTDK